MHGTHTLCPHPLSADLYTMVRTMFIAMAAATVACATAFEGERLFEVIGRADSRGGGGGGGGLTKVFFGGGGKSGG